ncbi:hypothetical protein PIB30_059024 [Stylosanthes scabra]|uniref:Uncharacterized protein n=1 Tax=Stylosanthes scabra TaxID=79078 RepID=A0ABU6SK41_9FABA|nr:hypothetical protein [Stylosanthes scabra]
MLGGYENEGLAELFKMVSDANLGGVDADGGFEMEGSESDEPFASGNKNEAEEHDVEDDDTSESNSSGDASEYEDVAGLGEQDIVNKVFRTEDRAYEFYMRLGKYQGFGVRKGDYGKDDRGNLTRR